MQSQEKSHTQIHEVLVKREGASGSGLIEPDTPVPLKASKKLATNTENLNEPTSDKTTTK